MNTKTMEGIVGAKTNMNMLNTPMRVYREARRKGDTGAMERAMGYAGDYSKKAESYRKETMEGMKEDAKEAREKEKAEREKAIEKRKEERKETEERVEKLQDRNTDTVEISEEGKILCQEMIEKQENGTGVSHEQEHLGGGTTHGTATGTPAFKAPDIEAD